MLFHVQRASTNEFDVQYRSNDQVCGVSRAESLW